MSNRNGDKARFGRKRIAKTLLRKRMRELRKTIMDKLAAPGPVPVAVAAVAPAPAV